MSDRLLNSLATTDALANAFSDGVLLRTMLRFEAALARSEAAAGVIPSRAAGAIGQAAADAGGYDAAALASDARASGTIVIPFVQALRARVRAIDADAATFVHWGATSQDVSDTALVLCISEAGRLLAADHGRLAVQLRALSDQHAGTVMLARTLLQPAPPTTFGLKAAGWLGGLRRSHARLASALEETRVLQFGGAAGTLAALGPAGPAVARGIARELGLRCPDAPWHTQRDRLAAVVAACGIYTGALGKVARDIALLMQYEVAEAFERGGGSSTMPHKRNPAGCALALAAATRVPPLVASYLAGMSQEHERGVGGWHAEAPVLGAVLQSTGAALAAMADAMASLTVDADRMAQNVAATNGVVFAERAVILLGSAVGGVQARALVDRALATARAEGRNFTDVLGGLPEVQTALDDETRRSLGVPEAYLGSAEEFRRRLVGEEID